MACNKCDNGMIREEYENGWTVNRCDCKTPEFWQRRQKEKKAERAAIIRQWEQKEAEKAVV